MGRAPCRQNRVRLITFMAAGRLLFSGELSCGPLRGRHHGFSGSTSDRASTVQAVRHSHNAGAYLAGKREFRDPLIRVPKLPSRFYQACCNRSDGLVHRLVVQRTQAAELITGVGSRCAFGSAAQQYRLQKEAQRKGPAGPSEGGVLTCLRRHIQKIAVVVNRSKQNSSGLVQVPAR